MIFPSNRVRVLVATQPVDFRKGHDGLCALVASTLRKDPYTGTVFVFRARRADRLKLLYWDGSGLVMAYKRLEVTTFTWPAIKDGIMALNHALHGKRSEKLTEDERQLAVEDLTIAVEEVEAEKEARSASKGEGPRKKPAPRRNIGNLPASLPRIETVIEPDSLICPCGCGVAIVARTNGATIATAQDRRRSHGAVGHRARAAAGDCHGAPEICV